MRVRHAGRAAWTLLVVALAPACASRGPARLPPGEDYLFPVAAPRELSVEDARRVREAWEALLADRPGAAEKAFQRLLDRGRDLVPARTGLGYARLRQRRLDLAAQDFGAVLAQRPDYVPALVGAGGVALAAGRPEDAFEPYRRAAELDPHHAGVRKRLAEIKVQATERRVAAAHAALAAGDEERAGEQYRRALEVAPEVAGLRLELAELLARRAGTSEAADVLAGDPSGDRGVLLRLGALREALGDLDGALQAYERVLRRDPGDEEAARRAQAARTSLDLSRMPEEYRRIFANPRLTRAELAALLSVRLPGLARLPATGTSVAVDVSGSWAREHILRVLALQVMEVYPNHTFQPGATVRRGDLAQAVARVLDLLGWPAGTAPALRDMSPSHLHYAAAERVVAAGFMDLSAAGQFEAWRPVSGRDAADVVDALARAAAR